MALRLDVGEGHHELDAERGGDALASAFHEGVWRSSGRLSGGVRGVLGRVGWWLALPCEPRGHLGRLAGSLA